MYLTPQEIHDAHASNVEDWHRLMRRNIDTLHSLFGIAAAGGRKSLAIAREGAGSRQSGVPSARWGLDDLIVEILIRSAHLAGEHVGGVAEILDARLGNLHRLAARFHDRIRRDAPLEFARGFEMVQSGAEKVVAGSAMGMQALRHAADDVEREFRSELAVPVTKPRIRRTARRAAAA